MRISNYNRTVFDKVFEPNFNKEEVFVVAKIQYTNPITFELKNVAVEEITGSFYKLELQATDQEVFRVKKVLKRDPKKKRVFISCVVTRKSLTAGSHSLEVSNPGQRVKANNELNFHIKRHLLKLKLFAIKV